MERHCRSQPRNTERHTARSNSGCYHELGDTSIGPNLTVVPAPNSAACSEGVTMNLANPAMMTLANATGATATPGISPPSPLGC
jgi:hypothetical protein